MRENLLKRSMYIITEFYQNNAQPLLDCFAEDCIWIGPARGQEILGRHAIADAFLKEGCRLTYDLHDIHALTFPINDGCQEVVVSYTVLASYPNGERLKYRIRSNFLWVRERQVDEEGHAHTDYWLKSCLDSTESPFDSKGIINPGYSAELSIAQMNRKAEKSNPVMIKGLLGSCLYLSEETLVWLESKKSHTLIHTIDQVYESVEHINEVVEKFGDSLCRVHISYAVNPMYVTEIGRFYVSMQDGTRLPMPEKRYTKIRDALNSRITALSNK